MQHRETGKKENTGVEAQAYDPSTWEVNVAGSGLMVILGYELSLRPTNLG